MVFCMDIGNTNIVLGCYRGDQLVFQSRVATDRSLMSDQYAVEIHSILSLHGIDTAEVRGAAVSSVVPALTESVAQAVETAVGVRPMVLDAQTKTGLDIRLDTPAELGSDLAATAVAAKQRYALPCVIIDMGTASTITVLDKSGAFLGGAIVPGVRLSLESLVSRSAMLVGISLDAPPCVIGANTVDCMKSGSVFGSAAMLDGMLTRIEARLGQKPSVVATGGFASVIVPHCVWDITLDDNLLMDGIRLIYEMNRNTGENPGF